MSHCEKSKAMFFEYRGLVGPVYQYLVLLRTIDKIVGQSFDAPVKEIFDTLVDQISREEIDEFEKNFFDVRKHLQSDLSSWIALNPLTDYGKYLQSSNDKLVVVTTKNKESVEILLSHYGIHVEAIFANEEIKNAGRSKGNLISKYMTDNYIESAVFVDDLEGHLDSVNDSRVQCYFADWGYGESTKYPMMEFGDKK
jgi:phosphoglycolate phosphatase-like HAD superfamily hydrolase